jgi:sugar phosphate isomerase/epimerase
MPCYLSTACFKTTDLDEIIASSLEHGFNLELSSALPFSLSTLESVSNATKQMNFLVHNYFPPPAIPFVLNLASTDPVTHQQSVILCKNAIDLCARLGAPFYSVHSGFALNLLPEDLGNPAVQRQRAEVQSVSRGKAYEIYVKTINSLALYAKDSGVDLLVENNVVTVENINDDGTFPLLLADIDELTGFFSDINDPAVGLLLDTGHVNVSAATFGILPEQYIEGLRPFIRGLHLSDNNGQRDTNMPIRPESWFAPYLKELAAIPMVIEVNKLSLAEMLQQVKLLESLVGNSLTP